MDNRRVANRMCHGLLVVACVSAIVSGPLKGQAYPNTVRVASTGGSATANTIAEIPRQQRVIEFIEALAQELPRLAAIPTSRLKKDLVREEPQLKSLGRAAVTWDPFQSIGNSATRLNPMLWLDSLRGLWPHLDTLVRAEFLCDQSYLARIPEALAEVVAQGTGVTPVARFADTVLAVGRRTLHDPDYSRVAVGDRWVATGYLLTGRVALAQRDTARAMTALLSAARQQYAFHNDNVNEAQPAARLLADLAEIRADTAQWIVGLTLYRLRRALWGGDKESFLTDMKLRDVYARYVPAHGMPPDVVPDRLTREKTAAAPLDLERYLDRQWAALYDRSYPVERAVVPPASTTGVPRLAIVEYLTYQRCGGCGFDDRVLSGIMRRYAPGQVTVLTYCYLWPCTPLERGGDFQDRAFRLYPWTGFADLGTTIPKQTKFAANGDTLSMGVMVDGRGGQRMPRGGIGTMPDAEWRYQEVARRVDQTLRRPPEARITIDAKPDGDGVVATVSVDGVLDMHRILGLRLLLVEDTVWNYSGTTRRIYQNVVRATITTDSFTMGVLLPKTRPAMVTYRFDVAATQAGILDWRHADAIDKVGIYQGNRSRDERDATITQHADLRDWHINRSRLSLVAFVQDMATGDILQAAQVKVPPLAASARGTQ